MSQTPPPPPQPPHPQQPPPAYRPSPPPPQGGMSGGTLALIIGLAVGIPAALVIILLLIAILLPALGASRRTAQRMQNSTQLRGLHQGMYTFSNSNKLKFPGLDSKGHIIPDSAADTGFSGDGDTVEARYWVLLDGSFITPDYVISPSENEAMVPYNVGQVDSDNYSYAFLSIDGEPGSAPRAGARASEWTQSMNTQAVVASDRNTGSNANAGVESIHTNGPGQWKGSVLWNDNHVAFEQTHILETRYSNGNLNVDASMAPIDNLFAPAGDADAWMIHAGD